MKDETKEAKMLRNEKMVMNRIEIEHMMRNR